MSATIRTLVLSCRRNTDVTLSRCRHVYTHGPKFRFVYYERGSGRERERERTHVTRTIFSKLKRSFDETKFDDDIKQDTRRLALRREGETHNRRKNRRLSLASSFLFSCSFPRNFIVMRFDFARTCAPDLLTLHDDSRFSINRDIGLHS